MVRCTFFLLWFSILLFSCAKTEEKITPIVQTITESVYASGIVKSTNQYKVFSIVNGLIATIIVKEGDIVKKGDAIISITNTNAQLNTNNAALIADYNTTSSNTELQHELQITSNLAKAAMDEDALLLQRQQNLWNQQIGTKVALEQRQLAYKSSVTAYQTAKLHFTQLQKKITFQSKQSQNNLLIASSIKDDYTIKAAADGRVYNILVKQGEMINTINAVAIIGDANNFILELQVDEADITQIKLQQQVFINMDSYKGKTFEATITKIYPILNEKSKSFTVEASFVAPPNKLYPNLTCEANILIQTKKNALTIPRNYLLAGDSVVMKSKKKRKVKVGLKDYQKVEIIQGISITDVIYKPIL